MSAPTPLVQSRRIGRFSVHALQAGGQMLDGGAMFGVVPKPLWERKIPSDPRNRIPMGMRCLLIEHESGLVLIDTGAGHKETSKFLDIYGIENDGGGQRTMLEAAIVAAGFSPSDISLVINTHLHFDHAGGNTALEADGRVVSAFPNARFVVQAGERHYAMHTNERTAASYFPRNWEPLREAGKLDLVDGATEIVKGIRSLVTPGHVPFHQSILIDGGSEMACFLGDVIPTHIHMPLPWIMGYDVEPLRTLESKRALLETALAEQWLLIFEHDASVAWGYAKHDGKAYYCDTTERNEEGGRD
ncbi:MAG: MBL fold metallo-hydrolase [Gemmatimonadetes bacterium]|nr:MBL fold metallo-hydrolase [Gemmatimonadota bacterium]